ncbi:DUF2971 domain-containing protein [Aeromonas sp. DNRA1]|uniref:DUF2971 domain-containing protein n=1 Tax=Aeromonas sp. DNRA1 TaxID=2729335 RepID=UPI001459DF1E|nr:DUF2971 domain-containing protein [Aeromonas sp. DNRA1]NME02388.1 DUF2971 domain-containing protein [Aeromonas sp. DNRA1]
MATYYKYYENFTKELLLEPTIKLSSPLKLNDPFEKTISTQIINQFKKQTNGAKGITELQKECESYLKACGIVSLTETHRNLLMWAHYGNDHKGVCIGYDDDFLSSLNNRKIPNSRPFKYKPVKVNYDRVRFDENTDQFNSEDQNTLLNEILVKTLTTKSDDWIYEKEHRCIVPMEWCDKLLIKTPNNNSESEDYWVIKQALQRGIIEKGEDNSKYYCFKSSADKLAHFLSSIDEVTVLKDICPSSITSIFIGCEASQRTKTEVIRTIRANPDKLGHITVYQYAKDSSRFELNPKKRDPFRVGGGGGIKIKVDLQKEIFGTASFGPANAGEPQKPV